MKVTNYGPDHPYAVVRGRVAGSAAVGTASLETLELVVISPAQLTANTDDWDPTGLSTASVIRASTDASRNLTGIVAPADDRLLILANIGAQDIVLIHDATSTAANRFYCPDNSDVTLAQNTWTWLLYDLTSTRWRVLGGGSGSIPAGTYVLAIEGGQEVVNARGTLGATETVDPTDGNIVTGTLDQDCTITVSAATAGGGESLEWWLTQSGGSWTPTFSPTGGTFAWDGGVTPTFPAAGQTFRVITERIPGTTNDLIGNMVGGPGVTFATPAIVLGTAAAAGSADTVIRSDATIVAFDATLPAAIGTAATGSAAVAARRDHGHDAGAAVGPILITDTPAGTPLVFADLLQDEAGTDLLYADV